MKWMFLAFLAPLASCSSLHEAPYVETYQCSGEPITEVDRFFSQQSPIDEIEIKELS